jgi:hypothetical protein
MLWRSAKNMKSLVIITYIILSLFSSGAEEVDLSVKITPTLKSGFGKIITIIGDIINDKDTLQRSDLGKKIIKVHSINGKTLKKPVIISLSYSKFSEVKIPDRSTSVALRGYESGHFTGTPQDAFKDISIVATSLHHFEHNFVITNVLLSN